MNVLKVNYQSSEASKDFTRSLIETGFAVLTDHPIPPELIADTFRDWKTFFDRPEDEKLRYKFDPKLQSGYFPFRTENAKDYSKKDLKEFYHLYSWNEVPTGMTDRSRELYDRLSDLAFQLLGWIEEETPQSIRKQLSMPLPEMIAASRETLLRPIHYPPFKGDEEEGAIRAAAHEDINLVTLLCSATAPGLQVKDTSGNWHDVPCDPGSIAINAGDMLQMATQGFYRSTTHRVINPIGEDSKKPRYSIPLFLHPRADVPLSETHTARSYLDERLTEIGLLTSRRG